MNESNQTSVAETDAPGQETEDALPEVVAVLAGGDSAERDVSLKSGEAMYEALENAPVRRMMLEPTRFIGERLRDEAVDCAVIALHGRGGEDGQIQALLDWHGIPYTGPPMAPSARCMDKLFSKRLMQQAGIETPDWFLVRAGEDVTVPEGFEADRFVVKPRYEGSSLGMDIVSGQQLPDAVEQAREFDSEVLVERYVEGYEATVGIVSLEETRVLPTIGIRPDHEFFDFETKYTKGLTEYDVPADLPAERREQLQEIAYRTAAMLETLELCRVDFLVPEDGPPTVLEVNTIPGFTETSLLPKAAREAGISFFELVWGMVRTACEEKSCPR